MPVEDGSLDAMIERELSLEFRVWLLRSAPAANTDARLPARRTRNGEFD